MSWLSWRPWPREIGRPRVCVPGKVVLYPGETMGFALTQADLRKAMRGQPAELRGTSIGPAPGWYELWRRCKYRLRCVIGVAK